MDSDSIRLLIVDDDPFTLKSLQMLFKRQKITVQATNNAPSAIKIMEEEGTRGFDCVLTDFRMPEMTGLELISWVKSQDASLSTILLTAEGDKQIVAKALRDGVSDFIEKPYRFQEVFDAVQRAVRGTRKSRKIEETVSEVRDITELHERINEAQQKPLADDPDSNYIPNVVSRVYPIKDSGGDFTNNYSLPDSRLAILLGDVSGHDLKAGFISAYFQGMVRGMIGIGADISTIFRQFNSHLCDDWNRTPTVAGKGTPLKLSLAAGFLYFDFKKGTLTIANHGLPLPVVGTNDTPFHFVGSGSPPLGWFNIINNELDEIPLGEAGCTYFCSDGLNDYCETKNINSLSLAWFLINQSNEDKRLEVINERIDDILVVRVDWKHREHLDRVFTDPFFFHVYPGNSPDIIDHYQQEWDNSLKLCLPELSNKRLWEISLCVREALINSLIHGCNEAENKNAYLTMWPSLDNKSITIQIRDEGEGYREEPTQLNPDIINTSKNRHISFGLTIIKSYSERCVASQNGSILEIDFNLELADTSAD